jgi:predicted negative regulator of RcsB-dependent stress response
MKKQVKIVITLVLLLLGVYFAYNYMYQDHRDIKEEKAVVLISASELVNYFNENNSEKVLNKTVQFSGIITEIDTKNITLDDKVQCSFDAEIKNLNLNETITVKGRCIGFDELFEVVKMDQSSIIK